MSDTAQTSRPWRFSRLMMVAMLAIGAFALIAAACGDDDDDANGVEPTPTEVNGNDDGNGNGDENGNGETRLTVSADDEFSFSVDALTAPANTPFVIVFENNDDDVVHNIAVRDADGETIGATQIVLGPIVQELEIDGLEAGEYTFVCDAHPVDMVGTLTVE